MATSAATFSDLPLEVLTIIWNLAIEKRVLELQAKSTQVEEINLGYRTKIKVAKLVCAIKVTNVLHVNRQSRAIGLDMYKAWDIRNIYTEGEHPRIVYFHPHHDKIRCRVSRPCLEKQVQIFMILGAVEQLRQLGQVVSCINSYPWTNVRVLCQKEQLRGGRALLFNKTTFTLSRRLENDNDIQVKEMLWEAIWMQLALV